MRLVLDAGVWLKWLIANTSQEPDTEAAVALIEDCLAGKYEVIQPPHWLAEVVAVLARLSPSTAAGDVLALHAMELPVADDPGVWRRGTELAIRSQPMTAIG